MSIKQLTPEQASKLGTLTAGVGLGIALAGAVTLEPIIIGVGAIGVAAAALVKLNSQKVPPNYTPTEHPMRRAEDRHNEHVGATH